MRDRFRAAVEDPPTIRAHPLYPPDMRTAFIKLDEWIQYWQRTSYELTNSPEITFKIQYNDQGQTATFKLRVQKGVVNMPLNRPTNDDGTIVLPTKLFFTWYLDDEEIDSVLKSSNEYRAAFFNHLSAKFQLNSIPDGTITYEAVPSID